MNRTKAFHASMFPKFQNQDLALSCQILIPFYVYKGSSLKLLLLKPTVGETATIHVIYIKSFVLINPVPTSRHTHTKNRILDEARFLYKQLIHHLLVNKK
jgi:hypothetical protein